MGRVLSLPHTGDVPEELYDAARVSRLMDNEHRGRWRLRGFTVTPEGYQETIARIHFTSDHSDEEKARAVPPGSYISLQRRMIDTEIREAVEDAIGMSLKKAARESGLLVQQIIDKVVPDESRWVPVMSDTPAEILEHSDALNDATGRVLITGLGLGCLPHALLTKPDVTRIDIIDIDPEVIALTGKYLTDPRVHIHQGDAREPERFFEPGTRFDYVWHDIWTHISDRNLDDETAEHGISYAQLFDRYDGLFDVEDTSAWAIDMAQMMLGVKEQARERELEFRRRLRAASPGAAAVMVRDRVIRERCRIGVNADPYPDDEPLPDEIIAMMDPDGNMLTHLRQKLSVPGFWEQFDRDTADEGVATPLGRPNAHLA